MINQKEILSDFLKLENMFFSSIKLISTGEAVLEKECPEIMFKEEHNIEGKKLKISLFCKVKIGEIICLDIVLDGIFECSSDTNIDRFLPNALAIMFPYLRSQVTTMTSQPNISPIILPTININRFLNK